MGFADNLKNAVEKGKEYASNNPDKADSLIDKAGDFIDSKTDNKYQDKIDQAQEAARNQVDGGRSEAEQAPAAEESAAPEQAPAAEAAPEQAPAAEAAPEQPQEGAPQP